MYTDVLRRYGTIKHPSYSTLPDLMFILPACLALTQRGSFSLTPFPSFSFSFSFSFSLHDLCLILSHFHYFRNFILVGLPIRSSLRACTWLPSGAHARHIYWLYPKSVSLPPAGITFSFSEHCIFDSLGGAVGQSWYLSFHPCIRPSTFPDAEADGDQRYWGPSAISAGSYIDYRTVRSRYW